VPATQGRHCEPVVASTEVPGGHGPMLRLSMRSERAVWSADATAGAVLAVAAGA